MSCEHLICAQCAGPVVEGRCQVCRAARAEVHRAPSSLASPLVIAALIVTLLLVIAALHISH
jgi:hypothetical protein